MSLMLPEGGEVMRRAVCGDVCPAPPAAPSPAPAPPSPPAPPPTNNNNRASENKELLRQQLLSASKERGERGERGARTRQKNRWKLKFHHQALPQEYLDHYERSLQKQAAAKRRPPDRPRDGAEPGGEAFELWAQRLAGAPPAEPEDRKRRTPAIAPSKIVTYDDLPYMGEMTLNDSKPRRGRKPKKADICHLIYENYGTVVPGRPPPAPAASAPAAGGASGASGGEGAGRSDLQNKLIVSLLERKLSAERRRREPLHSDREPLNLCLRDLRDLKLQIQRKFGNIYPDPPLPPSVPAPPAPPDARSEPDVDDRLGTPPAPEPEQPNAISVIQRNTNVPESPPSPSPAACWPAPLYLHPLALHTQLLYYQRLAAAGHLPPPIDGDRTPSTAGGSSPPDTPPEEGGGKLVLKHIAELLEPAPPSPAPAPPAPPAPAKRKRSAIFIPPVPARPGRGGPVAPTAEVSICKFKFTGGSKPSLQEKKMLSVDAGGNFRYYSGTGRGQPAPRPPPPPAPAPPSPAPAPPAPSPDARRKRKSRKTLQRERLERTFKEKGFLIQTQQLQSAEGATYCKFRQLRKFTRYLFRSWKDYLPGELGDAPAPPADPAPADGAPAEWG